MSSSPVTSSIANTVRQALSTPPVTRFAPSPTGYLHLGHVVNAIYVWGVARATGGHVRLRIEDHDRGRCREAFVDACVEDLAWLGFVPDSGLVPLDRQTHRTTRYQELLDHLRAAGRVYGCTCSRRDVSGGTYDGRCRDRGIAIGPGVGVRVRLDDREEVAVDVVSGPLRQRPAEQCGDVLIRDRDGNWTYQFAVAADDTDQGVTLVVRGLDLADSTGRQVALARLLQRATPPVFLHHPLIMGPDGTKLSKSDGSAGVRDLRATGLTAPQVIGTAAARAGLLAPGVEIGATDVPMLFRRVRLG